MGLRSFVPVAIVPLLMNSRDHAAASDWIYYTYSMLIIMTMEQGVYSYLLRRKIRRIRGSETSKVNVNIIIIIISIIFASIYLYVEDWNIIAIVLSLFIVSALSKTNEMKSNFEALKKLKQIRLAELISTLTLIIFWVSLIILSDLTIVYVFLLGQALYFSLLALLLYICKIKLDLDIQSRREETFKVSVLELSREMKLIFEQFIPLIFINTFYISMLSFNFYGDTPEQNIYYEYFVVLIRSVGYAALIPLTNSVATSFDIQLMDNFRRLFPSFLKIFLSGSALSLLLLVFMVSTYSTVSFEDQSLLLIMMFIVWFGTLVERNFSLIAHLVCITHREDNFLLYTVPAVFTILIYYLQIEYIIFVPSFIFSLILLLITNIVRYRLRN